MVHSAIATKRIIRDIGQVMGPSKDTLNKQGIYYCPNEEDSTKGIALLVGPSHTPYFGGYYFFSIIFPEDYPFSPVKVRTLTQDGKTRFNPNMYIEGKVCLSILNTWHDGPQWSGIQTLESVLLVIMSDVLTSNPLENEPAFRNCGMSTESLVYNRMLWHANLYTAIYSILTNPPPYAKLFSNEIRAEFETHKSEILKLVADASLYDGKTDMCRFFSMITVYDFSGVHAKLLNIQT